MISERTLRKWRREALVYQPLLDNSEHPLTALAEENAKFRNRIIKLTQELSDILLIKKG